MTNSHKPVHSYSVDRAVTISLIYRAVTPGAREYRDRQNRWAVSRFKAKVFFLANFYFYWLRHNLAPVSCLGTKRRVHGAIRTLIHIRTTLVWSGLVIHLLYKIHFILPVRRAIWKENIMKPLHRLATIRDRRIPGIDGI